MAELLCAPDAPEWLELRRQGITATDIVTIAGLVTWDSPWALYHRKLGLLPEVQATDRMRLGSWLEDAIGQHWQENQYHAGDLSEGAFLYRHPDRWWQLATPDFTVSAYDDSDREAAVLECKTSSTRDGWGPDGTDQVPEHVRVQVLWQMDTLGVPVGHVAVVFLPSGEFRSYTIRHPGHGDNLGDLLDCAFCAELDVLRDLGFGFWSRILRKEPPDLDGLEVTTEALRTLHPAPGGNADIDARLVEAYDTQTVVVAAMKKELREIQNQIRAVLGDAEFGVIGKQTVFRRTISKRAGYVVAPSEVDTLRRVGKGKADE